MIYRVYTQGIHDKSSLRQWLMKCGRSLTSIWTERGGTLSLSELSALSGQLRLSHVVDPPKAATRDHFPIPFKTKATACASAVRKNDLDTGIGNPCKAKSEDRVLRLSSDCTRA